MTSEPKHIFVNAGGPTWAIAAVGNNGSPNYYEYAKGFSSAAKLLLADFVADKGKHCPADYFVYPICFNMRHSIELRIKNVIQMMKEISALKNQSLNDINALSHKLKELWDFLKDSGNLLDKRFNTYIEPANNSILEFASIDPIGQTFRYPFDNETKKHLTDVAIINLKLLQVKFSEIEKALDDLQNLTHYLVDEYKHGTFTTNLSRADLFNIAHILPSRENWNSVEFDEAKARIKGAFGQLSNTEFSKALNTIQSNYETAAIIGKPISVANIQTEDFFTFFDQWILYHDIKTMKARLTEEIVADISLTMDFDSAMLFHEITTVSSTKLSEVLTAENICTLKSLYELDGHWLFSENFSFIFNTYQKRQLKDKSELKRSIEHLYTKPHALERVLKSLFFLGNLDTAEHIISRYKLDGYFEWLESARKNTLFSRPQYTKYN